MRLNKIKISKSLKKVVATVACAGIIALSAGKMTEAAANTTYPASASWTSSHTLMYMAPPQAWQPDVADIKFSNNGATAYCNSIVNSVNGADSGFVTILCTNASMTSKTIYGIGQCICNPLFANDLICQSYRFQANTSTYGNKVTMGGNVVKR